MVPISLLGLFSFFNVPLTKVSSLLGYKGLSPTVSEHFSNSTGLDSLSLRGTFPNPMDLQFPFCPPRDFFLQNAIWASVLDIPLLVLTCHTNLEWSLGEWDTSIPRMGQNGLLILTVNQCISRYGQRDSFSVKDITFLTPPTPSTSTPLDRMQSDGRDVGQSSVLHEVFR